MSSKNKLSEIKFEDSILYSLKNKGLLDSSTEKKLNEYNHSINIKYEFGNSNGNTNGVTKKNTFSKIYLIQEYRIIQNNISICNKQLENLEYIRNLKNKKIEILENSKIYVYKKTDDNFNINYKTHKTNNVNNKEIESRELKKCINNIVLNKKDICNVYINNNQNIKLESLKLVVLVLLYKLKNFSSMFKKY